MKHASTETRSELLFSELSTQQANELLRLQSNIMEMVVLNYEPDVILENICKMTEALVPEAVASIMLFDDSGQSLYVKCAPSIPIEVIERLNGIKPGPENGSCANAVYRKEPQYICNTFTDTRWNNILDLAENFNILACWSMPIQINENEVIGSIALSSFETRQPSEMHKRTLETAAYITSIIIKRNREQQQLWHSSHYDRLTNLPNRTLFRLRLDHAIELAERSHEKLALLYMDVDHFKEINDTFGHTGGDEVLSQIAERLSKLIRQEDTLARLGGDEFVLMIERVSDIQCIYQIADKILFQFSKPYHIHDQERMLSISLGISTFPDQCLNANELLQNADTAMYEAKKQGRSRFIEFNTRHRQIITDRINLSLELRKAIHDKNFILHYQPQFNYLSGEITAIEALIRWNHPEKGIISPNAFIPVAERTGLIKDMGTWVLKTACSQCMQWWKQGYPKFVLAINISPKQLHVGFSDQTRLILEELNFPFEQLEIEITENLIMEQSQEINNELYQIKKLGISIAMDDFGTGHSSLAKLKHLPINKLKIDRSFVKGIPNENNDQTIAETIISMGHTLGLEIVAEGVETEAQRNFLSDQNCDHLQGYLLSHPLSANDFETILSSIY